MEHRLRFACLVLLPFAVHADDRLGLAGVDAAAAPSAERAERALWPLGPLLLSSRLGLMPAHTTLALQPLTTARGRGTWLLGNYYLDPAAPEAAMPSGFRASSGVLLTGAGLRPASEGLAVGSDDNLPRWASASSYVGLGYTGAWLHGGLRFSADFGLSSPVVGAPIEPAYTPGNSATLGDDGWRLRSGPLLQLGMGYSF